MTNIKQQPIGIRIIYDKDNPLTFFQKIKFSILNIILYPSISFEWKKTK